MVFELLLVERLLGLFRGQDVRGTMFLTAAVVAALAVARALSGAGLTTRPATPPPRLRRVGPL
jgi:hypothetical protein